MVLAHARRSSPAVLALLLPSCITIGLWQPGEETTSTNLHCTAAVVDGGDGDHAAQLFVQVQHGAALASDWIAVQLDKADADTLRAFARLPRSGIDELDFEVGLDAERAGADRVAHLELRAEARIDLVAGGVQDVRPSKQFGSKRYCVHGTTSWEPAAPAPGRGVALADLPTVRLRSNRHTDLAWPWQALLTPAAVAADVVLSPFELGLLATGLWLRATTEGM
jgi:hypothetical protein